MAALELLAIAALIGIYTTYQPLRWELREGPVYACGGLLGRDGTVSTTGDNTGKSNDPPVCSPKQKTDQLSQIGFPYFSVLNALVSEQIWISL